MKRLRTQDNQHEFSSQLAPGIRVLGDTERLAQMLWNLLENAVQYTPGGGRVALRLQRSDGVAQIEIDDTGVGIGDEEQAHVFERFYRGELARSLRSDGTGLGLAIVKYIVEAHNGAVSMTSRPGHGTAVIVQLPAVD
jgi:signal transduction histidine kinase